MKRTAHRAEIITFGVLTALLLGLLSFEATLTNEQFYATEFETLGVTDDLGADFPSNLTASLLAFYTSKTNELSLPYLTENEVSHLRDVGVRVRATLFARMVVSIAWFAFLLYLSYRYRTALLATLASGYRWGGICTLALVGICFICALLFVPFFALFHEVLFPQGNYLFPADSLLLRTYPRQFFEDFLTRIAFRTLVSGAALLLIGGFLARLAKKQKS